MQLILSHTKEVEQNLFNLFIVFKSLAIKPVSVVGRLKSTLLTQKIIYYFLLISTLDCLSVIISLFVSVFTTVAESKIIPLSFTFFKLTELFFVEIEPTSEFFTSKFAFSTATSPPLKFSTFTFLV